MMRLGIVIGSITCLALVLVAIYALENHKVDTQLMSSGSKRYDTEITPTAGQNQTIVNSSELNRPANSTIAANHVLRIAFVKPTFTAAAYSYWSGNNSFYKFYKSHDSIKPGVNVTDHLSLLTSPPINSLNETTRLNQEHVYPMLTLIPDLEDKFPFSTIKILNDSDISAGKIFSSGQNLYDVLILGHQEYVTQSEYDHLKTFVSNGGKLVALDSNVFYAQVTYNARIDSITLLSGHSWAYNGLTAWRAENERWESDISSWIGGKTIECEKCQDPHLQNNPFNYSIFEEQYITNPKDEVLLDYNFSDPHYKIATYDMRYGAGLVLVFGIYSEHVIHNPQFIAFFNTAFSGLVSEQTKS